MLNGWKKDIAVMCIKSLENQLETFHKTGFPFSYGMKGLAELNAKEMIDFKINSIKQIINKPQQNSLRDIEPYCEGMIDITSLEKKFESKEKSRAQRYIDKVNKEYQIQKKYGKQKGGRQT